MSKISPTKTKSNEDGEKNAPAIPHFETNPFFKAIIERRNADAEKELDAVRATIAGTENGRGYLKALEGLLLTAKSNDDKYLYLSKIEKTQRKLRELRKEFANHTTSALHSDYDKGYFQALENYIKRLERTDLSQ
ncbi:MAG TPA: hypothetical protein VLV18_07080, partial [Terriglobales bacterium]|nr:hypothetical protein [Terriglobales bacterium]